MKSIRASHGGRNILSKHITSEGPKVILEDPSCQSEIDLIHFDHAREARKQRMSNA